MEISNTFLVLVPVVIGLVQVAKTIGLPIRFSGLAAIVLGIGGAFLLGGTLTETILSGIIVGLSAAGLYSATRSTLSL